VVPPLESGVVSSESCEKVEEAAAVEDGGAGDDKLVEDSAKDAGNSNSNSSSGCPVADGEHISSSAVAQVVEESQ
jgi:hypothetical protein